MSAPTQPTIEPPAIDKKRWAVTAVTNVPDSIRDAIARQLDVAIVQTAMLHAELEGGSIPNAADFEPIEAALRALRFELTSAAAELTHYLPAAVGS